MPAAADHLVRGALRLRGFKSRHVSTHAGQVHAMVADGDGTLPPFVLLHGLGSAGVHYRPLLRHLKPHATKLIVPDIPAHGFSEVPVGGANMETLGTGLMQALDALIDEPAIVYGNSMGGLAAIRYASQRPNKVKGLVLCSPGGANMSESELSSLLKLFKPNTHAEALEFVDRLLTRPHFFRHVLAFGVRRTFSKDSLQSLLKSFSGEQLLQPENLAGLKMPTLLLWGRAERILPGSNLQFFREHLPGHVKIVEPEKFGHSPHMEYPALLTKQIVAFAQEL